MRKIFTELTENELRDMMASVIQIELRKHLLNEEEETKFLDRKEAAKMLKVSEVTLSKYTKEGKIKGFRLGKKMKFRASDLNSALEEIDQIKFKRG